MKIILALLLMTGPALAETSSAQQAVTQALLKEVGENLQLRQQIIELQEQLKACPKPDDKSAK